MHPNTSEKTLSPWLSLLPIAILVGLLALTIYIFGSDALGGGSQVSLLMATGICVLIGMGVLRKPWAAFEEAIVRNISGVGTAIIILLIIGALSGAWVVSGVVSSRRAALVLLIFCFAIILSDNERANNSVLLGIGDAVGYDAKRVYCACWAELNHPVMEEACVFEILAVVRELDVAIVD